MNFIEISMKSTMVIKQIRVLLLFKAFKSTKNSCYQMKLTLMVKQWADFIAFHDFSCQNDNSISIQ
jgi:hypothetical protein